MSAEAGRVLRHLCAPRAGLSDAPSVLVVAAHPDDETLGLGTRLPRLPRATLLHLTDGAPRERRWWGDPTLPSREAYARVRRQELRAALALAGVGPERTRTLGLADQEASLDLAGLARRVAEVMAELRPEVVLTHPYEGGHPDHDAAAFAVRAACELPPSSAPPPVVLEFTSYHARGSRVALCEFLPAEEGVEEASVSLSAPERELKTRMIAYFASQWKTLQPFPVEIERFRTAPCHDFTRPPHPGPLHYERFEWGVTGEEWRRRAGEALTALGARGSPS